MSDELLVSNAYLFIYLRDNKNVKEKEVNILRCLEQGADVNAVDHNQSGNTPLHVAVTRGDLKIVQLLLDNKALPNVINEDQKTPLDIARNLRTNSGKQIFQLLNSPSKDPAALEKYSEASSVSSITAVLKPISKLAKKPERYLYLKRAGISQRGQFYETKLLSLVLLRAQNDKDIENFILGTNINGIGALDDICLKLKVKGYDKPIMIYLQAKHREDRDKARLTIEDVRNNEGDFSLIKYFDSYLKIKDKFKPNNSDHMFDGEFNNTETNLVIYTPAKDLFSRKLVGKNKLSTKVHNIISTAKKGVVFQFDYEDKDLESLTKVIIHNQVKIIGSIFLCYIMSKKDKSEVMMSNEYIARYHHVLSREVILVSDIHEIHVKNHVKQIRYGSFRSEFFTKSSEYLDCMREIFYKELSSTHCDKTAIDHNTILKVFKDILQKPNALHISRVIGKLATYNEEMLRLEIINTTHIKQVLENIHNDLSKLKIQPNVVREAVWLKLRRKTFNLPTHFGNIDMSFRGTDDKIHNRIKDVVNKLIPLFTKHQESKIIEINTETIGNSKIIDRGLIETNGGIGSAVGNLLVLDNDTNMFKIDVDNKKLPKRARAFLTQILHFINKDELKKYRLQINIDGFPKYYFEENHYEKRQATEFLNNLWFYTNQAQEDEVENILKADITKHYNNSYSREDKKYVFKVHCDAIFWKFHEDVKIWWSTLGETEYLINTNQYFQRAKDAVIDTSLLAVLDIMFNKKLQKFEIRFTQNAVHNLGEQLLHMSGRLNVLTKACFITALKISQHFHNCSNHSFIEFDYILSLPQNDYNTLIKDLQETKIKNLIIIYEKLIPYEECWAKLKQVMDAFVGENIIVVSENALADKISISEDNNHASVFDLNNNLTDLTEDSQLKILANNKITFQGDSIRLKLLLNTQSRALVGCEILEKLLNKEEIYIGKPLLHNTITESLNINDNQRITIEGKLVQLHTLYDIDGIVVFNSPKEKDSKSTYLTSLCFNTKRILGPLPWIVRITMLDFINTFVEWRIIKKTAVDDITVIRFLTKLALKRDFNDEVHFEENDSNIRVRNAETIKNPILLFELQLFTEIYNDNKVVFILDHSDLRCGAYEPTIMKIITVLARNKKSTWITTCPNCCGFRTRKLIYGSFYYYLNLFKVMFLSLLQWQFQDFLIIVYAMLTTAYRLWKATHNAHLKFSTPGTQDRKKSTNIQNAE